MDRHSCEPSGGVFPTHVGMDEELGIGLSGTESEWSAGDSGGDIIAEDADGKPVIIEHQLEESDHHQLGKRITCLTVIEARTAIWTVREPRLEPVKVVACLHESSPGALYLADASQGVFQDSRQEIWHPGAIRIGDSEPAYLNRASLLGPTMGVGQAGQTRKQMLSSEVQHHRLALSAVLEAEATTAGCPPNPSRALGEMRGAGRLPQSVGEVRAAVCLPLADRDLPRPGPGEALRLPPTAPARGSRSPRGTAPCHHRPG